MSALLSGITALLGLYSGVKGMKDSVSAANAQKRAIADAGAAEQAWYNRNYYGNYMDNSMSKALMKRVEETLRRRDGEARAAAAVSGATQEQVLARGESNRQLLDNAVTELASRSDAQKQAVDLQHQQRQSALRQQQIQQLQMDEQGAAGLASSGLGLLNEALKAVNWGKEDA